MFFHTIYSNYNYKFLAGVRQLVIAQDKFKRLALKKGFKVF